MIHINYDHIFPLKTERMEEVRKTTDRALPDTRGTTSYVTSSVVESSTLFGNGLWFGQPRNYNQKLRLFWYPLFRQEIFDGFTSHKIISSCFYFCGWLCFRLSNTKYLLTSFNGSNPSPMIKLWLLIHFHLYDTFLEL